MVYFKIYSYTKTITKMSVKGKNSSYCFIGNHEFLD